MIEESKDFRVMSQTIQISEESAVLLTQQAIAHGLTLPAWIEELAREKALVNSAQLEHQQVTAAIARILEIQSMVKPDPEGWTVRDYIDHGRR